jgi:hypothetical protein
MAHTSLERNAGFKNNVGVRRHLTRADEGVRLGQVLLQITVRHEFDLNIRQSLFDVFQLFWILVLDLIGKDRSFEPSFPLRRCSRRP